MPYDNVKTATDEDVVPGKVKGTDIVSTPENVRPLDNLRAVDDNAVRVRVPVRGYLNPLLFFCF